MKLYYFSCVRFCFYKSSFRCFAAKQKKSICNASTMHQWRPMRIIRENFLRIENNVGTRYTYANFEFEIKNKVEEIWCQYSLPV